MELSTKNSLEPELAALFSICGPAAASLSSGFYGLFIPFRIYP